MICDFVGAVALFFAISGLLSVGLADSVSALFEFGAHDSTEKTAA